MKIKKVLLVLLVSLLPCLAFAQDEWDDVYSSFGHNKKEQVKKQTDEPKAVSDNNQYRPDAYSKPSNNYLIQSGGHLNIDVDAYNRRGGGNDSGQSVSTASPSYGIGYADDAQTDTAKANQAVDGQNQDYTPYQYTKRIVNFHNPQNSVKISSDSSINVYVLNNDYSDYYNSRYSQNYWDDYYPYNSWYGYGPYGGWYDGWYGWGGSPWYGGWYGGWYSPWYCGWYGGYSPWYSGWYYPGYWWGSDWYYGGGYYGGGYNSRYSYSGRGTRSAYYGTTYTSGRSGRSTSGYYGGRGTGGGSMSGRATSRPSYISGETYNGGRGTTSRPSYISGETYNGGRGTTSRPSYISGETYNGGRGTTTRPSYIGGQTYHGGSSSGSSTSRPSYLSGETYRGGRGTYQPQSTSGYRPSTSNYEHYNSRPSYQSSPSSFGGSRGGYSGGGYSGGGGRGGYSGGGFHGGRR